MNTGSNKSVKSLILNRIASLPFHSVFRSDVSDIGDSRKVTYVLNALVKEHKLVHLGRGVYAKAYPSKYMKDKAILEADFDTVTREVLNRLNVNWKPGLSEKRYNSGKSTQVPANCPVVISGKFNRKLTYGNVEFEFERANKKKRSGLSH